MRKRLFMLSALLLLVGLALESRYGDVVPYTADWLFVAATLVVFAAWCFSWPPDHRLVALSTDWTALLMVVAVLALTLASPYRYGAQVEAAKLGAALLPAVMVLNLVQERGDLQFFLNHILFFGVGMAAVSFAFYMAAMSRCSVSLPCARATSSITSWSTGSWGDWAVPQHVWGVLGAVHAACFWHGHGGQAP